VDRPTRPGIDTGLLILRLGLGLCFLLLFTLKQAESTAVFGGGLASKVLTVVLVVAALCLTLGFLTRLASGLGALAWMWSLYLGIASRQPFYNFPVRAVLFLLALLALAFTGAGRFSADHMRRMG